MKDLKHYFTDNNLSECDTSKGKEVTVEESPPSDKAGDDNNAKEVKQVITTSGKKRGRVKIKISGTGLLGKICDIVESSSDLDLVDKTPSPFALREVKENSSENETPKTTKSRKNCPDVSGSKEALDLESNNGYSSDEDSLISRSKPKVVESSSQEKQTEKTLDDPTEIKRKESNAFQVLMTKKKPIQYKTLTLTPQEQETMAKVAEDSKKQLKRNREKLISLADKKGYTKRKLEETEEAEKIEKRLEKRAKVFRLNDKSETQEKKSPLSLKRVCPGSLHNYFSKAAPDLQEKDSNTSSIVVQADVHLPHPVINHKVTESTKIIANPKNIETEKLLATMDTIQVLESSDSSLASTESPNKRKKPRWSLRINIPSNQFEDGTEFQDSEKPEKTKRRKSESKARRERVKATNNENVESVKKKSSKNKRSQDATASSGIPVPHEIQAEKRSQVSTPVFNEEEIVKSSEIEIIEEKITNKDEKLAPLFVKRPRLDPAVIEARRAFLQFVPTGSSDRTTEKIPAPGSSFMPFPTISHVMQLDVEAKTEDSRHERIFPERAPCAYVPSFDLGQLKFVTDLAGEQTTRRHSDDIQDVGSNIEQVLGEIESGCSDVREIWTKITSRSNVVEDHPKNSPKRRGRKKKSDEVKNTPIKEMTNNCAWTEKYRPTSARDIVGNEQGAEKFRKWLSGWETSLDKNNDGDGSSGDEFYPSDCSHTSNVDYNQVAVLLGPHGSGKTASVYAIAEELGYSVLEVNASSKRAGKKILKELEEATKSHRIRRNDFTPLATITSDNVKTTPQNSLILMEDVDLIFEEDEGFISATSQLVSNTKRPIVMTGRSVCSHLSKMAPKQTRIYYENAAGSRVSALLELITIAESGYRLPRPCLDKLLQNGDLRKALLQLQYLLMSGKPSACEVPTNFNQSLWQDMRQCIYKPAIRGTKKSGSSRKRSEKKSSENVNNRLADDLDKLSLLSTMIEVEDPVIEISSLKLEPSLSLDENTNDYSSARATSMEIAEWLRNRLMNDEKRHVKDNGSSSDSQNFRQLSLKKDFTVGVNLALSQVSPLNLNRGSTMLDYLSTLRTICRAEELRTTNNSKRGNRFFHYLHTLRLPSLSTRPSILAAACKMMRNKNSES